MTLTVDHAGPAWRVAFVAVVAIAVVAACTRRLDGSGPGSATMPDPGGCYALVSEGEQFEGAREFINGPRKNASLEDLPFRANWRRRIRSVQVGPPAFVTMWADEGWRGASETLSAGSREPVLSKALSGRVQSLEIGCDR